MKVVLVIDDREIELNDKDVNFAEGEQVKVDGDVKRVESVHKAVTVVGSSADLAYRVILK